VYSVVVQTGDPSSFCDLVFNTYDKDNSGHVDFREFMLALNMASRGTPEDKLNFAFDMCDLDGNGVIDEDEMLQIVKVRLTYEC
jgi:Ca2+-binding EF-hand superfamily protein